MVKYIAVYKIKGQKKGTINNEDYSKTGLIGDRNTFRNYYGDKMLYFKIVKKR